MKSKWSRHRVIYRGSLDKVENRILGQGAGNESDPVCPECGLHVKVRVNGILFSHTVGRNRANSWVCSGSPAYLTVAQIEARQKKAAS